MSAFSHFISYLALNSKHGNNDASFSQEIKEVQTAVAAVFECVDVLTVIVGPHVKHHHSHGTAGCFSFDFLLKTLLKIGVKCLLADRISSICIN